MSWIGDLALNAVGPIVSGIGNFFGMNSQASSQEATNKSNELIAERNNAFNKEMWEKNNEYNKPVNQIARYKEAGLNPALIYGTSGSAGNSSGPVTATNYDYKPVVGGSAGNLITGLGNALNQYMDLLLKKEQIEKTASDRKLADVNRDFRNSLLDYNVNKLWPKQLTLMDKDIDNRTYQHLLRVQQFQNFQQYIDQGWRDKMWKVGYESAVARGKEAAERATGLKNRNSLWDFEKPMLENEYRKRANDALFYDDDTLRYIDYGLDVFGKAVDSIGGLLGGSLKWFIGGKNKNNTYTPPPHAYNNTYVDR